MNIAQTLIILLFTSSCLLSQPYKMSKNVDAYMLPAGIGLSYIGAYIHKSIEPFTHKDSISPDRNDIFWPDRFVTGLYSETASDISDILLTTYIALPLSLNFPMKTRNYSLTTTGMYIEAQLINFGLMAIVKGLVKRVRPYVYNENVPIEKKIIKEAQRSFFSGHTSIAFTSAVFLGSVFERSGINRSLNGAVWSVSLLGAASVAVLRIAGGKHFLTDVLAGAVIGSAIGYIVPKLHENDDPLIEKPGVKNINFSFSFPM